MPLFFSDGGFDKPILSIDNIFHYLKDNVSDYDFVNVVERFVFYLVFDFSAINDVEEAIDDNAVLIILISSIAKYDCLLDPIFILFCEKARKIFFEGSQKSRSFRLQFRHKAISLKPVFFSPEIPALESSGNIKSSQKPLVICHPDLIHEYEDVGTVLSSEAFKNLSYREKMQYLFDIFSKFSDALVCTEIDVEGWGILAARAGCQIYSNFADVYTHAVYPHTAQKLPGSTDFKRLYLEAQNDNELSKFYRCTFESKVSYFNTENSVDRFINFLTPLSEPKKPLLSGENPIKGPIQTLRYSSCFWQISESGFAGENASRVVVVCVVKDCSIFIESWMAHYQNLGINEFYIVDTGSSDDTVEKFSRYDQVTVLGCSMPFSFFESEIRRYVIEKYANNRWCLTVDIDEFFDFPRSSSLSFDHFIEYLDKQSVTAVTANMLDMFTIEDNEERAPKSMNSEDFRRLNNHYELVSVKASPYLSLSGKYYLNNTLESDRLEFFHGGVRSNPVSGNEVKAHFLLLKHCLTFQNGELLPQIDPHFCEFAYVSAARCVLYHYKLLREYETKVLSRSREKVFNYFANIEYETYTNNYTLAGKLFNFIRPLEFKGINDLESRGFVLAPGPLIKASYNSGE